MSSNRHLKVFKTYDEYSEYIQTQIYRTPSVFIIKENEDDENKEIHYQSHDIIINNIREYFTIENIGDYELTLYVSHELVEVSAYGNLYYCFKNSDIWQELGENEITIPINESVKFKGVLNKGEAVGIFNINGNSVCRVYGNIMSLVYGDNFFGKTDLSKYNYVFCNLLQNCTSLVDASELILPATTLASYCYQYMFDGCTSLTTAPELLATTLASNCYYYMFNGCTNLTEAPQLPATTLTYGCYAAMFKGCTSLISAPQLPATTLANNCYQYMFRDCTNLTTAPQLLATTLAYGCYSSMFRGCTSLTTAPELPATTLANYCYNNMFRGCTSLNNITMLATNISASSCLYGWVYGVASKGTFTKHPQMTSLTNGSSGIPYGWTVKNNYDSVIPFITNLTSSYVVLYYSDGMFTPSSSMIQLYPYYSEEKLLSFQPQCDMYVDIIYKDDSIIVTNYLWETTQTLGDVISKNGINSVLNVGINILEIIIPSNDGWYYYYMNKELPLDLPFFTIEAIESGDLTINPLFNDGTPSYYSLNNDYWTEFTESVTLSLSSNDTVMLKGVGNKINGPIISTTNKFNVKGNVMSLLYGNDFEGQMDLSDRDYAFSILFNNCATLTNANELILPATTLASYCYYNMFGDCKSLTSAPQLLATTLSESCYYYMFRGCTSLTTAPELPATTLANWCYHSMFRGCTSLTTVPELPATTLAGYCYTSMFQGCSGLTSVPNILPATTLADYCYSNMFEDCTSLVDASELILPAITLATSCYSGMFRDCTSLTTAPQLLATTLADYCYSYMFYNCTSLVSAPNILHATTLADYCCQYMFRGCIRLGSAPQLLATTLKNYCYQYMFYGCTNLRYIKMLANSMSSSSCLKNWVDGVASYGTFVKTLTMTTLPKGSSGIPNGWTVINDN